MIAMANGGGVEALCLSRSDAPMSGRYTRATQTCAAWALNSHGAVDEPPDYGETARAAYAAEANSDK
jgi:hypothetical protein